METKPDTDFSQFADAAELQNRRAEDREPPDCDTEEAACPRVYILERRADRHRDELNQHMAHIEELKTLVKANGVEVTKNSVDTAEILEIVTLAKSFFKVLGWVGDKLKTIMSIIGVVSATFAWFKYKS
jgi:hypothetical protein